MKSRILFAAVLAAAVLSSCAEKKVYLFNGENLDGWEYFTRADSTVTEPTFSVVDGVMHISGQPFGYIRNDKVLTDYKLHLEWRWAGGESVDGGIYNRVTGEDKVWPNGIQFQMTSPDMGILMTGIPLEGVEGPFYKKARIVEESGEKPVGEWNTVEFECVGGVLKAWMNGVLVNEAKSEATEGYIAFQSEGGAMEFRNIYLF